MLAISVSGLPAGTAAAAVVTGAQGYHRNVSGPETISGLIPGSYTLSATEVIVNGDRYVPAVPTQNLILAAGTTPTPVLLSYLLVTGRAQLTLLGVPPGSSVAVSITGPGGFVHIGTASELLTGLAPGSYLAEAGTLMVNGDRYDPQPASQSFSVAASTLPVPVTVAYAPASGSLSIAIGGLPGGVPASVTVNGPAGYSQTLTGSQILSGLSAGSYAVTATSVSSGGVTYAPTPVSQSVEVAGGSAFALVTYTAGGGGGLDLRVDGAYLTQATQRYDGTVPLVAGRDAFVRVFALASQANTAQPQVRVRLYAGAALLQTYTISAPVAGVPLAADQSALSNSWNLLVPGALVQPGLRVLADVDPAGAVAEGDEANNQFPLSGIPGNVDVRALPTFALRFVPVLQQVNGLQGNVTDANKESFLGDLKAMLPVGAYDAEVRLPYTTTAPALQSNNANGAWGTILSEVLALRFAEGAGRYYYGVVKVSYGSGVAGLGYVGGMANTAIGWDHLPSGRNVMAHEVGHNMGRAHAPCGNPSGPDPNYPYAGGQIGVWGLDVATATLKSPSLADLMGYCHPNWVSDYSWSGMLSYRQSGPSNSEGDSGDGLLVWGRITDSGIVLEPAFRVPARGQAAPRPGPHRLELLAANGAVLRSVGFDASEVADLPGGSERQFAFVVPLDAGLGAALGGLRVRASGRTASRLGAAAAEPAPVLARPNSHQVELRWDANRYPMVLVREAASGQILSFARGGLARLWSRSQDFELQFSDGVRSVPRRGVVLR